MNIIMKENLNLKRDFLVLDNDKSTVVFSTALDNRSFNRNTDEGKEALNSIVNDFNVKKVLYLNQVHSDKVYAYKNEENFIENDGDGIITNERNVAVGVFTADCVPVIIVNEINGVIGAVHSGWKGTFNSFIIITGTQSAVKTPIATFFSFVIIPSPSFSMKFSSFL